MNNIDILIADDEPHIVRALSFIFQKEGFCVETAADGEEAIAKFSEFKPQIVFLDMVMPVKDGLTACRAIREVSTNQRPHIIFLTCKGQDTDRQSCIEAGADDFLNKPFSPREVLEKVRLLMKA